MRARWAGLILLGGLLAACGDDDDGGRDAAVPLGDGSSRDLGDAGTPTDALVAPDNDSGDVLNGAPPELLVEEPACGGAPCKFISVGLGYGRTCTVSANNEARCWGALPTVPPGRYLQVLPSDARSTLALTTSGRVLYLAGDIEVLLPLDDRLIFFDTTARNSCGLRQDRRIICWVDNTQPSPLPPPPGPFAQLSVGLTHSCARRDDGSVVCWPAEAGNAPPGLYKQVGAGKDYSCALKVDDTLVCWKGLQTLPVPAGTFRKVQVSLQRTCALTSAGVVLCWDPLAAEQWRTPDVVLEGSYVDFHYRLVTGMDVAEPEAGCGVRADGGWRCWGANLQGQGRLPEEDDFIALSDRCGLTRAGHVLCWSGKHSEASPLGDQSFTELDEGDGRGCALTAQGQPRCWNSPPGDFVPQAPAGVAYDHLRVDLGEYGGRLQGACAIRRDTRQIECWPQNPGGVAPPSDRFTTFRLAKNGGCGVREDGALICWPRPGETSGSYSPFPGSFKDVGFGAVPGNICALSTAGELSCTGEPTELPKGPFTQLSRSSLYFVALRPDGSLQAVDRWHRGARLSNGTFVQIGRRGGCALSASGRIKCWEARR